MTVHSSSKFKQNCPSASPDWAGCKAGVLAQKDLLPDLPYFQDANLSVIHGCLYLHPAGQITPLLSEVQSASQQTVSTVVNDIRQVARPQISPVMHAMFYISKSMATSIVL